MDRLVGSAKCAKWLSLATHIYISTVIGYNSVNNSAVLQLELKMADFPNYLILKSSSIPRAI